ncbi:MAG TPA: hypothetical protein DEA08_00205 [Planctomycetes bacterium]|nr:hypothetical protein [Planctomycetota bacterium]
MQLAQGLARGRVELAPLAQDRDRAPLRQPGVDPAGVLLGLDDVEAVEGEAAAILGELARVAGHELDASAHDSRASLSR